MLTRFYSNDSEHDAGNGNTGSKENNTSFPEDPGTESKRIPDGGGPADGFIDEQGHSTGNGFLGHIDEEGSKISQSGNDAGSTNNG